MNENEPPPPPLDYRPAGSRDPQPAREPALRGFLLGLFAGTGASCFMWVAGWDDFGEHGFPGTVAAVLVIKLICAIVFITSRRFPGIGAGLLTSIPIGGLIFFGSCASHAPPLGH